MLYFLAEIASQAEFLMWKIKKSRNYFGHYVCKMQFHVIIGSLLFLANNVCVWFFDYWQCCWLCLCFWLFKGIIRDLLFFFLLCWEQSLACWAPLMGKILLENCKSCSTYLVWRVPCNQIISLILNFCGFRVIATVRILGGSCGQYCILASFVHIFLFCAFYGGDLDNFVISPVC